MVSEIGHLSGAFWGGVVAIVLVKAGLVDCEGWDVFSLWARNRKLAQDWKKRGELLDRINRPSREAGKTGARPRKAGTSGGAEGGETDGEDRRSAAVRKIRRLLENGNPDAAADAYSKAAQTLFGWPPPQPELYALIKDFHDKCRSHLDPTDARPLPALSRRLDQDVPQAGAGPLAHSHRPAAARKVLQNIPAGLLSTDL